MRIVASPHLLDLIRRFEEVRELLVGQEGEGGRVHPGEDRLVQQEQLWVPSGPSELLGPREANERLKHNINLSVSMVRIVLTSSAVWLQMVASDWEVSRRIIWQSDGIPKSEVMSLWRSGRRSCLSPYGTLLSRPECTDTSCILVCTRSSTT